MNIGQVFAERYNEQSTAGGKSMVKVANRVSARFDVIAACWIGAILRKYWRRIFKNEYFPTICVRTGRSARIRVRRMVVTPIRSSLWLHTLLSCW